MDQTPPAFNPGKGPVFASQKPVCLVHVEIDCVRVAAGTDPVSKCPEQQPDVKRKPRVVFFRLLWMKRPTVIMILPSIFPHIVSLYLVYYVLHFQNFVLQGLCQRFGLGIR